MTTDPHLIPDTTGDVEPTTPDEVVLPVQFSASGAAEISSTGFPVPAGTERVQLVQQSNGNYGLRFVG